MLQEKIEHSIKLLKTYQDVALSRCPKGYIVGYSGGKDSDALVELFFISGVKFHIIHNHTTIDAPETVYYIRKRMKEFENRDEIEMRNNINKKSQNFRFDDEDCKVIDTCYSNNYVVVNPIVDWTEKDVYQFLESVGLDKTKLNPLYSKGQCRVGCIGCPMSTNQKADLSLYPKYKQAYINLANKILKRSDCTLPFKNGEEFIDWWVSSLSIDDWKHLHDLKEKQIKMF